MKRGIATRSINKKRLIAIILVFAIPLLCGCKSETGASEAQRCSRIYTDLFDTVTTIVGYADSEADFDSVCEKAHEELLRWHKELDIYNDYPGMNNLKTVNDQAGKSPVILPAEVIDFLKWGLDVAEKTGGAVDMTFGSVIRIWHTYREEGIHDPAKEKLPAEHELREAAKHTGRELLVLDSEKNTAFLTDPQASLDVGALAKGYAEEKAAASLPDSYLISIGGNVRATGTAKRGGEKWTVAVQDPDGAGYLHTVSVTDGAVVTSGDYERYYTVDGKRYCHIISPETLFPADRWRSVTVICKDAGLADALSTALFILPKDEGEKLAKACGAECFWVAPDGGGIRTDGYITA